MDETALVEALKDGSIAGAALDVMREEYELCQSPAWQYQTEQPENLLLTPHIGGNTYESFKKQRFFS